MPKPPQPLFPAVPYVTDLFQGDLQPLVSMLSRQDLIFVMYYAPWCARTHTVKSQFLKAAQFLYDQVNVMVINFILNIR